jgi:hypothetical protein
VTQKSPIPDNMSGNWQHKVMHFEIPPPEDAWNKIASQLDEEFDPAESMLSMKVNDYEINPPPFILEKILTAVTLDGEAAKQPAKVLWTARRVGIAAAILGLISISLVYLLKPGSRSSATGNQTLKLIPAPPQASEASPSAKENNGIQPDVAQSNADLLSLNPGYGKKTPDNDRSQHNMIVKRANPKTVISANASSPISVTAPPIYDGNGNIIMDETLVSAPDENYIIVTSPNGEQTKISRKFLKMLTVMNGGDPNPFINPESFEWRIRFEQWKRKLLQQASYIPTANNFLDIMDLKEILQENQD